MPTLQTNKVLQSALVVWDDIEHRSCGVVLQRQNLFKRMNIKFLYIGTFVSARGELFIHFTYMHYYYLATQKLLFCILPLFQ
jgi:hypothetical protein